MNGPLAQMLAVRRWCQFFLHDISGVEPVPKDTSPDVRKNKLTPTQFLHRLLAAIVLGTQLVFGVGGAQAGTLKVLTINVWSGLDYVGRFKMGEYEAPGSKEARFRSLVAQVKILSPDVVFIQEANPVAGYAARLGAALAMEHIHQVVNGGIKVGPVGIPTNLKEGLVILARSDLALRRVNAWKLSGSMGIHSDLVTFQSDEAVWALVGGVTVGKQALHLVNVHLVAAPRVPNDLPAFKRQVLERGDLEEAEYESGMKGWRGRIERRSAEIRSLIDRLKNLPSDIPCIVGGDFNAEPDSAEIAVFKDSGGMVDVLEGGRPGSFEDIAEVTWDADLNENTAFSSRTADARGKVRDGYGYLASLADSESRRLDYIFLGRGLSEEDIIDRRIVLKERIGGVMASDHYGVLLEVVFPGQP